MKKFVITNAAGVDIEIEGSQVIRASNMFMVSQIPDNYCGFGLYVLKVIDGRSTTAAFFPNGTWQRWRIES